MIRLLLLGLPLLVAAPVSAQHDLDEGLAARRAQLSRQRQKAARKPFRIAAPPKSRFDKSAPPEVALTGPCYRHVRQASRYHNVDAALIAAVIYVESRGRPRVVSHAGAAGCMQLMKGTAAAMKVTNRFDPQQNVMGGTAYLRRLVKRLHGRVPVSLSTILSAYNMGPYYIKKDGGRVRYPGARRYATQVIHTWSRIRKQWDRR